ncbi:hypothetical protein QO058_19565 [Bosea vestrisii]|uniref:hypothetical protein n=1 Tax=Bosea vestrisii TaxID=151416 RepID=UPI0024DFEE47|nr:hypothetical protein [Bosea vestrisii]WID95000.1 hypothetical protein QO058_19565 [Bosea vestrisii]
MQILLRLALGLVLPLYLLFDSYELFFAPREREVRELVPQPFKLGKTLHFAVGCGFFAGFVAEFEVVDEPIVGPSEFDRTRQRLSELDPYRGKGLETSSLSLNRNEYLVYKTWQETSGSLEGLNRQYSILSERLDAAIDCWDDYDRKHDRRFKSRDRFLSANDLFVLIGVGDARLVPAIYHKRRFFVFGPNI